MNIRNAMEEAFQKGEKFKEQIIQDVMSSTAVNELMQNEYFLKSLSALMNTKYELKKAIRSNLKNVLRMFNLPSRDEIHSMERKIHRLESEMDGINRKVMTARLAKAKGAHGRKSSHHSKASKSAHR